MKVSVRLGAAEVAWLQARGGVSTALRFLVTDAMRSRGDAPDDPNPELSAKPRKPRPTMEDSLAADTPPLSAAPAATPELAADDPWAPPAAGRKRTMGPGFCDRCFLRIAQCRCKQGPL